MVPTNEILLEHRLITPSQAVILKDMGVMQKSFWGWNIEPGKTGVICFEPDTVSGAPMKCFDWSTEENSYAAFDSTELDYMLYSIGYYPCGPVYKSGQPVFGDFNWWCDDVINVCQDTEESLHAAYGPYPAVAKGNLLIQQLRKNVRIPANWIYYTPDHLADLFKGKTYGKDNDSKI